MFQTLLQAHKNKLSKIRKEYSSNRTTFDKTELTLFELELKLTELELLTNICNNICLNKRY